MSEGGIEGKREEEDGPSLLSVFPACPPSNVEASLFYLHILWNMALLGKFMKDEKLSHLIMRCMSFSD